MGIFSRIIDQFDRMSISIKVISIISSFIAISGLDLYTGYFLSFSVFYAFPVVLMAWTIGKKSSVSLALLSSAVWITIGEFNGDVSFGGLTLIWNFCIRSLFLILFALVASELREQMRNEEYLADVDGLTGLLNRRSFYEFFEKLYANSKRYKHPMSFAYLDLDNFKSINDRLGHETGDEVLRLVSDIISQHIRQSDLASRLGGDEFAIVLTETGFDGADVTFKKLQSEVNAAMSERNWEVTMSIGALSCISLPDKFTEMISAADHLMFQVKKSGKNSLVHRDEI
jgi:diguanylate cyclase (GGDEF)-like protein